MEWKRQPSGPHVVLTNCFENKKFIIQRGAGGPTKITTSGSRRWWWSVKSSLWETWSRPSVHLVQLKYNDGAENVIEDTCWFSLLLWLWTKHEHSVLYRRVNGIGQQVFFDVTIQPDIHRDDHIDYLITKKLVINEQRKYPLKVPFEQQQLSAAIFQVKSTFCSNQIKQWTNWWWHSTK